MKPYTKLRLCINWRAGDVLPSCGQNGSRGLIDPLEKGLAAGTSDLELETVHCMGKCHIGPILQLIPQGPMLFGVQENDIDTILDLLEKGRYEDLANRFAEPSTTKKAEVS
ncbi:(2Fe-2S) ferredoxin domain-containing protein [Aestuariispira insulae]|uniref:(2Fe-2S) ferredoxin n=1 Tax=Aestuariispira insulae TaxID=1461337 RepID=A0A3D9HWQ6_9PROT|nr:(2Fe-2S) ferredoxin domain-containing protein [Aestuariispira insulae]RED53943.1 hypothetical protein DFP90_101742 [Aestuariispira insulae]